MVTAVTAAHPMGPSDPYQPNLQHCQRQQHHQYYDPRQPHLSSAPVPVPSSHIVHSQPRLSPHPRYSTQLCPRTYQPSPPQHQSLADDDLSKLSLPSIANLLDMRQGERPSQSPSAISQSPAQSRAQSVAPQSSVKSFKSFPSSSSSKRVHYDQSNASRQPCVPSTPFLRSDSVLECIQSLSTISPRESYSGQSRTLPSTALTSINSAPQQQQQQHYSNSHMMPGNTESVTAQQLIYPIHMSCPGSSYTSAPVPDYASGQLYPTGMHNQRLLPSNFQPTMVSGMMNAGQWDHVHSNMNVTGYFPTFSGVHERYVCPTCKKAFSRPSSLQIHLHSHTGEKPFKCPRRGCNKAFSVRSNMKRHERGCHPPETNVQRLMLPLT